MKRNTLWIVGAIALVFILTAAFAFGQSGLRWWHPDDMHRGDSFLERGERGHHDRMHESTRGRSTRGMHDGTMPGMHTSFDSEADYLAMMIPHHEEAVERSRELLELTDNAAMVELLESIIAEQTAEIELMEGWLAERYPDVSPSADYEPMMRPYDGMSAEEAKQVFIEDMIPHHMHAIMSSRSLLRSSRDASEETRELASNIIMSQRDEIHLMHDLYAMVTPDSTGTTRGRGMMGSRGHMMR